MFQNYAVLAICLLAQAALAQDPAQPPDSAPSEIAEQRVLEVARSSDPGRQPFFQNFARDEWSIWSSPFRTSSYSGHAVKKYLVPFALVSIAMMTTDDRSEDTLPDTPDQRKWAGRISQVGAAYTLAGATGMMFAVGRITGDKHMRETGWLGLEALAHTQVVVFGMKQVTNRRRPADDYINRAGFWKGGGSFPSGHSATIFSVATVFAYEYRDHMAVPVTAYSVAALVAASRVSARKHWLSDVCVGGSTGFLIGRFVYKRHHDPNLPGSRVSSSRGSRLMPDISIARTGPTLTWAW